MLFISYSFVFVCSFSSGMAQLFGEDGAAAAVDRAHSWLLDGKESDCGALAPQCDDVAYPGIKNRSTPATPQEQ